MTLKPLSIIYNARSGFHASNKEQVYEQLLTYFTEHGFEIQAFELGEKKDFPALMQTIIQRHRLADDIGVIVAAGGDGTLNSIAKALLGSDIPLGVLPLGTFNYVARVLNIPLEIMQAAEVIATGQLRPIHVAKINDQIYLNNASLGLYPLFIQRREQYNAKFGRFPLHAYTSGLAVLIRDRKELKLEVEVDGKIYPVKTPLIFFGNNQLQLEEMKLRIAKCAERGQVAGVVVAKTDKLTLFRILLQLIRGELEKAPDVYSFAADDVKVYSRREKLTVAIDGEIVEMRPPLHITVQKNAVNMLVPNVTASV